jgi:hypothetical protein
VRQARRESREAGRARQAGMARQVGPDKGGRRNKTRQASRGEQGRQVIVARARQAG